MKTTMTWFLGWIITSWL